ncbi:VOC family protein [Gordonia alkaliphila]|uniref:VOC family protein n=1 Tax=Gordonia alkaliphila TaxID=1053547 RepID=A0ABP8ZES1_9ACTN
MQKIVPNIWCDGNAEEVAAFYASVLPNTTGRVQARYPSDGLPEFQQEMAGKPLTVEVLIGDYQVVLINAGPEFPPNPSISLMLSFDPAQDPDAVVALDRVWAGLSDGGEVLMELGEYPFSPRYGWVRDRYGVGWQVFESPDGSPPRPFVMPLLLFGGAAQNQAGPAIALYTWLFDDAEVGVRVDYESAEGPVSAGSVRYADFTLSGEWLAAMDSALPHDFSFTCGVSLQVNCADQAEIDRYWESLSAVPEAEQCGWCADRFGVSWQVVPADLESAMVTPEAYTAMMGMKKIVIADFPD